MASMSFRYEAWTEYGIGVAVLFLRYFARWKTVGFRGWEGDDYAAIGVLVFWTLAIMSLDLIIQHGTNLGLSDELAAALTSQQIASYEIGSKWILVGRNFHVTLVWLLKACMLFFYSRVVRNLPAHHTFVKWTGVACAFAYVGAIACVWVYCIPVQRHWQVMPYPGDTCTHAKVYYIGLIVFNVSTDIVIVSIPLSWLPMLRATFWRKVAIGALLCSGCFIIAAATVRCVLTLLSIESIFTTCMWSVREPFVAIITVNAGVIKPLFSKNRWFNSRVEESPMPSADKNMPDLHPMQGPCLTGSTLKSDIEKSDIEKYMTDVESGDHSIEYTKSSSEYKRWLQKEITDSSILGDRNGSTDSGGILDKTSTKGTR